MEWISVKEKLPNDESVIGPVAVLVYGKHLAIGSYADNYGLFFVNDENFRVTNEVTHWLPLPQPPIGE